MIEEKEEFTWESLLPHISELRKRLAVVLAVLLVGTAVSFAVADRVIRLLAAPAGGLEQLQAIEITETIGVFMRVALMIGVAPALPALVWQLLAFIRPALEPDEKRWLDRALLIVVPSALVLFVSGIVFSYVVMLPASLEFLRTFLDVESHPRISNYINFVTALLFWIGISFETPLVIGVMARLKLVSARALADGWRVAVVLIAVIAAVVTPTVDPMSMALLMLPLLVLYGLSILLAKVLRPKD